MSTTKTHQVKHGKPETKKAGVTPHPSFIDTDIMKPHKEKLEAAGMTILNENKVENAAYVIIRGTNLRGQPDTLKIEFDLDKKGKLRTFLTEPGKQMQPMSAKKAVDQFLNAKGMCFSEISEENKAFNW